MRLLSVIQYSQPCDMVKTYMVETASDWHYPNVPIQMPQTAAPIYPDSDPGSYYPDRHPDCQPASMTADDTQTSPDVVIAEPELKQPPMYAVVMYNDDYTTMEFVVDVLQTEFHHSLERAMDIMFSIHQQGKGIAGIYAKDIAETKAKKVNSMARREGYPLLTQIEPQP